MQNNVLILITIAGVVLGAIPASAQSASELLEKGIYLEETAGQVEEAIEIYRQILGDATADRAHVAEALLRLGTCHLKQGDAAAATAAFERIFAEYPEQEGLVARARAQMPGEEPLELLPAPWEDGEVIRMTLKLASGVPVGVLFMTADAAELDGEELWRLQMRHQFFSDTRNQTVRQVLARRDTMVPVSSFYRYPGVGHFEARYGDGKVGIDTIETGAKREEKLDGPTFDSEEIFHLIRRLPLEVGAKRTIRVISTMAGGVNALKIEVAGKEMITVPAGELECYRVELAMLGVFWYSTDPSQVLVKLDAAGLVAELEEVYVREPSHESAFRDEELGFSVNLPPDWLFHRREEQGSEVIYLLDPRAEMQARMEVRRPPGGRQAERVQGDGGNCIFYTATRQKLEQARTVLRDYELRKGTWSERRFAGWPAVSFAGNYRGPDREMVDYWTFIENDAFCVDFTLKVVADRFEALRSAFDRIIGSYQAPPPEVSEVPEPVAALAVRSVLDDFHLGAAQADRERVFEHLASDAVFFGTGAADRFTRDELRERFSEVAPWLGEPSERHVYVSGDGTLAWFDERIESQTLGKLCASGVLRRAGSGQTKNRDGGRPAGWRIVQYHVGMHLPLELLPDLLGMLRAHDEETGRQPVDSAPPLDELADESGAIRLLREFHLARAVADSERYFESFAPEAIFFGSTARLTLARYRVLMEPVFARGEKLSAIPVEQRVYPSPSADLVWFEELVEEKVLGQLRATGVLRKVGGSWKLAHYSVVFLVPRPLTEHFANRIDAFYAPG